jgi:hypothetical protein
MAKPKAQNRYQALIEIIFFNYHREGLREFEFAREEIETTALAQNIKLPKNLGDMLYSFRYRNPLPDAVLATHWTGMGYRASRSCPISL